MEKLLLLLQLASFLSLLLQLVKGSNSSAATPCFAPDRAALHKLASALPAPDWLQEPSPAFVGWEGNECCSWNGVVCSSHARVSQILLSNMNLVGTIPSIAVCSLSALSTLDLSHNYLSGSIPLCLGQNLTSLRQLDLSYNLLNGTIPTSFSALLHLRSLNLAWNMLDSSIPVFTNGTPNLQYLDLSQNYFTSGTSNLALSTSPLQQLQYLDLSGCVYLSGDIPVKAFISHLPRLRTLLLNLTALVAQGPQVSEMLCGLKSLEVFSVAGGGLYGPSLSGTILSGEIPALLPSTCKSPSPNLTLLDLSQNNLRGPFPAWMSLFSNLQVLDLSANNLFSPAIPPEWQNLTKLTFLRLSGPMNSTLHPTLLLRDPQHMLQSWLFRLPLQTLTLSSLGLTNQLIACSQLSLLNATLQSLDLSHNLLTDGHALQCLAHNNFTALASLDLSHNALAFNLGLAIPPSLNGNLNLASCQLEGELTDQFFGMLRSIRYPGSVSLARNHFSGTLPVGIGVLSAETYSLDLSYNNFTGPLPHSLGNLTYLRVLHLENNHLEGEIPEELGNMGYVHSVFLGNNQFTKCLYTRTQSTELEILDLSHNRLEGDLIQMFFGRDSLIGNLLVLLLGDNKLTGALPAVALNGTTALYMSIIQLSGNRLTGTIPPTLFNVFPSLTPSYHTTGLTIERDFTLVVKSLQLAYDFVAGNQNYRTFAYLDLSNNRLHGSIPQSMGNLTRLRFLNLSTNQLTGNIPSSLANLSDLESLDLSYNKLQGPIPTSLSKLTQLAVFNVSFNERLSGSIPTNSPQFEDNTSYIGDPNLCGEPYLQPCSDRSPRTIPRLHEENQKIHSSEPFLLKWIHEWIAIPGLCIGHVVGFLGVLWVLKLKHFV